MTNERYARRAANEARYRETGTDQQACDLCAQAPVTLYHCAGGCDRRACPDCAIQTGAMVICRDCDEEETVMRYEIQIKGEDGEWSADYVGANNLFESISEALKGIDALRALGDEWANNPDGSGVEYRVVAVEIA